MPYFNFDESLHVNNKLVDQEHKVLIDLINGLKDAVDQGNKSLVRDEILPGLIEYTKTHFFVEEEIMQAYNYPDYAVHKKAHDGFRQKIQSLQDTLGQGDMEIPNSVMIFLKQWLSDHIMVIDKKLAKFLREEVGMS